MNMKKLKKKVVFKSSAAIPKTYEGYILAAFPANTAPFSNYSIKRLVGSFTVDAGPMSIRMQKTRTLRERSFAVLVAGTKARPIQRLFWIGRSQILKNAKPDTEFIDGAMSTKQDKEHQADHLEPIVDLIVEGKIELPPGDCLSDAEAKAVEAVEAEVEKVVDTIIETAKPAGKGKGKGK